MPQIQATKHSQITEFLAQNGGIAIVDCYATWCGPCKFIAPHLHQKSNATGVGLVKINVQYAQEVAEKYGIKAMPTIILVQGTWDNKVDEVVGASKDKIDALFEKAASLKK